MIAIHRVMMIVLAFVMIVHGPVYADVVDLTISAGPMLSGIVEKSIFNGPKCKSDHVTEATLTFSADLESGRGKFAIVTSTCGSLLKSFPSGACNMYGDVVFCDHGVDYVEVNTRVQPLRKFQAQIEEPFVARWSVTDVETAGLA